MSDLLGTLEKIELRTIWASEAGDFTPWLAKPENLAILGRTIGLDLEFEAQEKDVGPYRADILCKDTSSGNWVLIENQLERTDHIHLGQLLTYATGLQAVTIVWIAGQFTEEHRATLDWLNEVTDEKVSFFGLEVELWRINGSVPAPKFNIISKPNNWRRIVTEARARIEASELTPMKRTYLEYWTALRDHLIADKSLVKPQKPAPQQWTQFAIGRAYFHLSAVAVMTERWIATELYMFGKDGKAHFHLLSQEKSAIEKEIGTKLEWEELPEAQASRIRIYLENTDIDNRTDWERQHIWFKQWLDSFSRVFGPRVKKLDATAYKFTLDRQASGVGAQPN